MYYIKWTPDYFDFDYCYGFKSLYDARHWIEHGHKIHDIAEHMYSVVIRNSNGIYKRRFFTIDDATAFITTNTEEHDDYILSPPSHTHNYSYNDDIGYIFFLLNPAIPNLVYIKFTLDEPNKFLEILSSGTGMPSEFIMAYQQKLDNFMDTK